MQAFACAFEHLSVLCLLVCLHAHPAGSRPPVITPAGQLASLFNVSSHDSWFPTWDRKLELGIARRLASFHLSVVPAGLIVLEPGFDRRREGQSTRRMRLTHCRDGDGSGWLETGPAQVEKHPKGRANPPTPQPCPGHLVCVRCCGG